MFDLQPFCRNSKTLLRSKLKGGASPQRSQGATPHGHTEKGQSRIRRILKAATARLLPAKSNRAPANNNEGIVVHPIIGRRRCSWHLTKPDLHAANADGASRMTYQSTNQSHMSETLQGERRLKRSVDSVPMPKTLSEATPEKLVRITLRQERETTPGRLELVAENTVALIVTRKTGFQELRFRLHREAAEMSCDDGTEPYHVFGFPFVEFRSEVELLDARWWECVKEVGGEIDLIVVFRFQVLKPWEDECEDECEDEETCLAEMESLFTM